MRKLVFISCLCLSILLVGTIAMADYNVLVVLADSSGQTEATVVESFTQIGGNTFTFEELNIATGGTRPMPGAVVIEDEVAAGLDIAGYLSAFDIIWFTWNAPGHDGDYFLGAAETAMLEFVERGGMLYMSAFDDNFTDANGNQIGGWMPIDQHPASVSNTGDSELTLTAEGEASGIFDGVDLSGLTLDDNFNTTDTGYTVLATRDDNSEIAAFQLDYGLGAYFGVCVDARSTFPAAEPMVENLLAYMAELRGSLTSVEPVGKIPTAWGDVKSKY